MIGTGTTVFLLCFKKVLKQNQSGMRKACTKYKWGSRIQFPKGTTTPANFDRTCQCNKPRSFASLMNIEWFQQLTFMHKKKVINYVQIAMLPQRYWHIYRIMLIDTMKEIDDKIASDEGQTHPRTLKHYQNYTAKCSDNLQQTLDPEWRKQLSNGQRISDKSLQKLKLPK